jgi:hypothetical protein
VSGAIFDILGDRFLPAPEARALWYDDALHGGPIAALFARQFERTEPPAEAMVSRLAVDLMRPVPTKPLSVETEVVRPGRRIQVLSGTMWCEGVEVARASALRIRLDEVEVPDHPSRATPAGPEGFSPSEMKPAGGSWFHVAGVEIRFVEGDFFAPGPATGWIRLAIPLFPDEPETPLQRVAAVADFGNGFSRVLGDEYVFINPDLSIHMSRYPEGEWICLKSRTDIENRGVGLAQSELFDGSGAFGHAAQALYVDRAEGIGSWRS